MSRPTEQSRFGKLEDWERLPETAPIGWTREDEDGWLIVDSAERAESGEIVGYWALDKLGGEHYFPVEKMGDNWKSPEDR